MFRPCIDLHEGKVKQIVGGTLGEAALRTNFVSDRSAAWFAELYRRDGLAGGHVIMLGPGNESEARAALAESADAWAPIRARVGAKDDVTFNLYRRRYLDGVSTRPVGDVAADAHALFKSIDEVGGPDLVGGATDLDPAAFYDPAK